LLPGKYVSGSMLMLPILALVSGVNFARANEMSALYPCQKRGASHK